MKSIFNLIFSKNTKSTFQNYSSKHSGIHNAGRSNQTSKTEPQFSIFDNAPMKEDYQVSEISFDEFKSSTLKVERRKLQRKPGETRRGYSTKQ
jgi:hypothetical protein